MELWFTEKHTPNVNFSIKVSRQLFSKESDFQQIDIFESPEFGRFLALDGVMMLTEKDEYIYHEMITHTAMAVHPRVHDVLVIGAGDHGYPFATNFNPEINIREVSANGSYWENGKWVETKPMEIKRVYDFPEIGPKDMYLLHHEEIESLALNIKGVKRIRFFMTFGQSYLTHLKCLEDVGMTSIEPIEFEGKKIVPLQFLKAVLPDPSTLGPRTKGKTNIGCIFQGVKDGKERRYYVYNVCTHEDCYAEVGSQAVAYTTGVPAMIGAMMLLTKTWNKPGVFNIEEFDPDPFMEALNKWGLPWKESFNPALVD